MEIDACQTVQMKVHSYVELKFIIIAFYLKSKIAKVRPGSFATFHSAKKRHAPFLEPTGSLETALISCDGLYKSNLNVSHLFSF